MLSTLLRLEASPCAASNIAPRASAMRYYQRPHGGNVIVTLARGFAAS